MKTVWMWLLFSTLATAQTTIPRTVVKLSVSASTGEKRAYFLTGETVEVEGQIFNALTHQLDSLGAPLYIDWIDNQQGKLLRRLILKPKWGRTHFSLVLPDSLPLGCYQLRAYTNWMRNFSPEAFGLVNLLIVAPTYKHTMPLSLPKATVEVIKVGFEGGALVTNLRNNVVVCTTDSFNRPVITSGIIGKDLKDTLAQFQTDSAGQAAVNFTPEKSTLYWIQAGAIRLPLTLSQPMGSVLRCEDITFPDRLRVTVENQYGSQQDTLTLVIQNRGRISSYARIPMQTPVTVLNVPRTMLKEGITTLSLVDQYNKVLNERMIYQGSPSNLDSDSGSWLNAELNEPVSLIKPRQISQALVLRHNTLFSWDELTKERPYLFAPELGIRVSGQVSKWNHKPITQPVTVSLLAQPIKTDTLSQEQLLFTETDARGRFQFQDLTIYGTYKAVITAKVGHTNTYIELDSMSVPPIKIHLQPIDWSLLVEEKSSIEERFVDLQAKQQQASRLAGITLQTVTVRATSQLMHQRKFTTPPSVRLDRAKVLSGGVSDLGILFSRYVTPRFNKLGGKQLIMVDDAPIRYDFELPAVGIIDHIDIHEGTGDAFYYGVDLVVAIYTIFQTGVQSEAPSGKRFKLVGFDEKSL